MKTWITVFYYTAMLARVAWSGDRLTSGAGLLQLVCWRRGLWQSEFEGLCDNDVLIF